MVGVRSGRQNADIHTVINHNAGEGDHISKSFMTNNRHLYKVLKNNYSAYWRPVHNVVTRTPHMYTGDNYVQSSIFSCKLHYQKPRIFKQPTDEHGTPYSVDEYFGYGILSN